MDFRNIGLEGGAGNVESHRRQQNSPPRDVVPRQGFNEAVVPDNIREFASRMDMRAYQINAQRFLGPRFYVPEDYHPGSDCEVFVGRLPRLIQEPEILPFFQQAGQVFQIRLLMNFSGSNKGFCFIKYYNPRDADYAVKTLHNTRIRPGFKPLVVRKCLDNRRLLLAGFPTYKTASEIEGEVRNITEGVISIQITWLPNSTFPTTSKGMIIVNYESHRMAAMARKKLLSSKIYCWGYRITTDWAPPEGKDKLYPSGKLDVLQVKNISPWTPVHVIAGRFNEESCNGVTCIVRYPTEIFIYMASRAQAEMAKHYLNESWLHGNRLQVRWYKASAVNSLLNGVPLPEPQPLQMLGDSSDMPEEGTDAQNEGTDAQNEGTDAQNEGSDAQNEGSEAQNEGSDAQNEGSDAQNEGTEFSSSASAGESESYSASGFFSR